MELLTGEPMMRLADIYAVRVRPEIVLLIDSSVTPLPLGKC